MWEQYSQSNETNWPRAESTKHGTVRKTTITMPCHFGLHARTAALFIRFARLFDCDIRVRRGGPVVDGKSILGLLTLGASWNTELQVEVERSDADEAIQQIKSYFLTADNCAEEIPEAR